MINAAYHYRAAKRLLKEAEDPKSTPERVDTLVKLADRHMIIYRELLPTKPQWNYTYSPVPATPQDWQVTYGDSTTSLTNVEKDVEGDAAGSGYQGV